MDRRVQLGGICRSGIDTACMNKAKHLESFLRCGLFSFQYITIYPHRIYLAT